jgi:hypothetical protein
LKEKIFVFIVMLLMILSVLIIPSNLEVEATGGSGGGENENFGLDYNYIWNITDNLSKIIYIYPDGMIPRGRAFGSWGGNYAKDYIKNRLVDLDLEDVHTEQIKHINYANGTAKINRNYTTIINVSDFQLTVNNNEYPFPNPIPIKESFVMVSGFPHKEWDKGGSLTHNYSFTDAKIKPQLITDLWPLGGTFTNFSLNITSFTWLNSDTQFIAGNLTYIESDEAIPDSNHQIGRVFLFNNTEECSDKLDDLTVAEGCILIDQGTKGISHATASKCLCPVVNISSSDGNTIKELMENYSTILVDNVTGNLTLTYNLSDGCLPSSDYMFLSRIPTHDEPELLKWFLGGIYIVKARFAWWLNQFFEPLGGPLCKGLVLYDSYEHHFMLHTWVYWDQTKEDDKENMANPALPMFTLNYTIGSFLQDNHSSTTLTGYCNQTLLEETNNSVGVEAYNVIGNITIPQNPNDAITVISNRYDGWWGQTPGDSGIGGAIVLGIAKYMKDYNITPKYNLSFVFTTGEEYGLRGAKHYNDSHPDDNIVIWLGLDQLGMDQQDVPQNIYFKNETHEKILEAISDQTDYSDRTGYGIKHNNEIAIGSEQGVFSKRKDCDTIWVLRYGKNYKWDRWHRTGMNYTEGDSLKYTDRDDVNVTAEMAWNITKYFLVNPDCWFENYAFTPVDTDDEDNLNDSVDVTFTIKTVMPHDLVMVNATLTNQRVKEQDGIIVPCICIIPQGESMKS